MSGVPDRRRRRHQTPSSTIRRRRSSHPALGDTITLGVGDYPIYPQDRTYSFGAIVSPDPAETTLTATGQSADLSMNITGYQTVVNTGDPPTELDWSSTTSVVWAPTVSIIAPVSAVPGDTIWIRVQQDETIWSAADSIVVPVP